MLNCSLGVYLDLAGLLCPVLKFNLHISVFSHLGVDSAVSPTVLLFRTRSPSSDILPALHLFPLTAFSPSDSESQYLSPPHMGSLHPRRVKYSCCCGTSPIFSKTNSEMFLAPNYSLARNPWETELKFAQKDHEP